MKCTITRASTSMILLATLAAVRNAGSQAWAQGPTTAPATQPAVDVVALVTDVQANLDLKQYPAAVKAASKVLALRGPAASSVDRFQITMQKGYAQAGMKSVSSAIITFKSAMKETNDPHQVALAKWTAELFRTAGSTTYAPKSIGAGGQKRGPFDLMDPEQRKDAFVGFLDDNLALLEPKLRTANISQKLPEIFPVLQQVVDLDQLDQVANANDDKTSALASTLLDHARNLLTNALKADWARVNDMSTSANIVTTVPTQVVINNSFVTQTVSKKNGLSDSNRSELNNIISVCQKIHDAAESFLPLAKTDKDWTTVITDSDRVAARASDVLNADYGSATSTGSTVTDTGVGSSSTNTGTSGTGLGINGQQYGGTPGVYPTGGNNIPRQPVTPNQTGNHSTPSQTPTPAGTIPTDPSTPPTKTPTPPSDAPPVGHSPVKPPTKPGGKPPTLQ